MIDYWLRHKHGAEFVCFDGWIAGYPPTRGRSEETKKMTLTDYFGRIADQSRARTNLPIWISEFHGGWSGNPQFTAANHASCYLHALESGVSVALLWDPELQKRRLRLRRAGNMWGDASGLVFTGTARRLFVN